LDSHRKAKALCSWRFSRSSTGRWRWKNSPGPKSRISSQNSLPKQRANHPCRKNQGSNEKRSNLLTTALRRRRVTSTSTKILERPALQTKTKTKTTAQPKRKRSGPFQENQKPPRNRQWTNCLSNPKSLQSGLPAVPAQPNELPAGLRPPRRQVLGRPKLRQVPAATAALHLNAVTAGQVAIPKNLQTFLPSEKKSNVLLRL